MSWATLFLQSIVAGLVVGPPGLSRARKHRSERRVTNAPVLNRSCGDGSDLRFALSGETGPFRRAKTKECPPGASCSSASTAGSRAESDVSGKGRAEVAKGARVRHVPPWGHDRVGLERNEAARLRGW